MKDKTHSVDFLALFNKGTVITTRERIQGLRGDKGRGLTNADVRQYCLDTGIKLEFASQNTLSRSERTSVRAGRL